MRSVPRIPFPRPKNIVLINLNQSELYSHFGLLPNPIYSDVYICTSLSSEHNIYTVDYLIICFYPENKYVAPSLPIISEKLNNDSIIT